MSDVGYIKDTGLRGITVASTKISDVIGEEGKLIYRGYLAKDLVGKMPYEELVYLLLYEELPDNNQLEYIKAQINRESPIHPGIIAALKTRPKDALPMDILQSAVSMAAHHDPDTKDSSHEAAVRMAIRLIAKVSTIVAAWERIRNGKEPVEPDPSLSHAANFLYMINGERPDDEMVGFFDTCLLLHAEHSFNASTFTARQVASTRAHMYASIAAAVGSLSGELHGGANTRVMEMLKKIGSTDAVEEYIENQLKEGKKVMGLGHAVYKVDDPRALIIAPMSRVMGERKGETKWYEISKQLEIKAKEAFKKHKNMDIFVNVDFYSASLYFSMGFPMDQFTPIFAVSRIAGWTAHILEEQFAEAAPKPALYRPESDYVGDYCGPDVCEFKPIEER